MNSLNLVAFSARINYLLSCTRLTKKQLARIFHCSTETLNKWKNGQKAPNEKQLEAIKKIFNIKSTEELNVPPPYDWSPAKMDGYTMEEWRARAIIAEQQLDRLHAELDKRKEEAKK